MSNSPTSDSKTAFITTAMDVKPHKNIRLHSSDPVDFFNLHDRYEKLLDEISSDSNSGRKYRAQYLQYKKCREERTISIASAVPVSQSNTDCVFQRSKQLTINQKLLCVLVCLYVAYVTVKLMILLSSA